MLNNRIVVLSETVANQIAAGEVVERAASVVKELVENALDAQSSKITVHLRAGGKQQISIQDDGAGMNHDDVLLAFERHATSKISDTDDLLSIATFGFRGEALPSIASVSRIILDTKRRQDPVGTRVVFEGGILKDMHEVGCPDGTRIEVRDLFYNTPARRKFMKSVNTELNHIKDILQLIILAHPGIHFRVFHNDTELFNYPAVQSLQERVMNVFSRDFLQGLKSIDHETTEYSLKGYVGIPTNTRSARDLQYLYVNGRPVRNGMVNHAIYEAYQDTISKGRHPIYLLFLSVSHSEVDVNVHPAKIEVRFRKSSSVHDFIRDTVSNTLRSVSQAGEHQPADISAEKDVHAVQPKSDHEVPVFYKPWSEPSTGKTIGVQRSRMPVKEQPVSQQVTGETQMTSAQGPSAGQPGSISLHTDPPSADALETLSEARLIGQLHRTFILLEDNRGLIIIDQHTAHERILYTQYYDMLQKTGMKSQGLLFPVNVAASPADIRIAMEYKKTLVSAGFEIEEFGKGMLLLRSVPESIGNRNPETVLLDILAELKNMGKQESLSDIQREIARILACRSAVKSGDLLDSREMEHLVELLCASSSHYTCPHGRPIVIRYSIESIQKCFGR